ncbi:Deoxyhypusine synthase [Cladochytrium replicatum]|nr:Deoxyhypusine synthase [Cladochytrium replicatum]
MWCYLIIGESKSVLVQSEPLPDNARESLSTTGFQATSLGNAITEINRMVGHFDLFIQFQLSDETIAPDEQPEYLDTEGRAKTKAKIFLGHTSNLVSSGLRKTIRYLVQHKMVDVLVATSGGVEEDIINLFGAELRKKGLNRIGNLLGEIWTPSKIIHRLGNPIDNPPSICYWPTGCGCFYCGEDDIPIYCPALTDGSLGDMIYFHSYKSPGLIMDIAGDIRAVNSEAVFARKTGIIILGGGIVKHHICNANLMRNGADFAVYINNAQDHILGKIKLTAEPVKVYADAPLVFPLIAAETFAKHKKDINDRYFPNCLLVELYVW